MGRDDLIAGVVVLYHPSDTDVANIASYAHRFDRLFLIDNSETDNAGLFAHIVSARAVYIPLMKNYGIAHALNLGFEKAKQEGIAYVVTMDQDSRFETDIVAVYREFIQARGMRGVLALTPQYRTDRSEGGRRTGYEKIRLSMQSGCLFSVEAFERIDRFDDALFLDVADWEFFVRGWKAGLTTIRCNGAVLAHRPGITRQTRFAGMTLRYGTASPVRYYYQIRNLLWAYRKHRYAYFLFVFLVKWAKIFLLFDHKAAYIRLGRRAIADALAGVLGEYRAEEAVV